MDQAHNIDAVNQRGRRGSFKRAPGDLLGGSPSLITPSPHGMRRKVSFTGQMPLVREPTSVGSSSPADSGSPGSVRTATAATAVNELPS